MVEVLIGSGLRNLASPIEREIGYAALVLIPEIYQDEWKRQTLETRTFRSGQYYRGIHRGPDVVMAGGNGYRDVISDEDYSQIIETYGWGPGNPGRQLADRAITAAEPLVEKTISDFAGRAIDEIEG